MLRARSFVGSHVGASLVALLLLACGGSPEAKSPTEPVRTCLVLSVGGPKGIAHIGAIAAVKQLGIPIQCVVGNSMGALIGSLYATAPGSDTAGRYRALMTSYVETTAAEARDRGLLGGLLVGGLVLLAGGDALPVLAGGATGALIGAESVDKQSFERFHSVLNRYYGGAFVERLPVPFATMHQRIADDASGMVDVRSGNLASAVAASVANPLLFTRLDPRRTGVLDPGVDRVAAIPIDDACRMFPNSRLIAINVTGKAAFVSTHMNCEVVEIDVSAPVANPAKVLVGQDPDFTDVVNTGYRAALAVLGDTG
jgi:predicted acylesterase/phospholipase RssA